ncbi:DUF7619 domain-containing protein [Flavobacterium pedocola]
MKKFYFLVIAFCLFNVSGAQIINFPDANFKAKLLQANLTNDIAKDSNLNSIVVDINNDNEIQINEALLVYYLDLTSSNINSVEGINNFINLRYLYGGNNLLTSFNSQGLVNLKYLYLFNNQFTSLDVSHLISLLDFDCSSNNLLNSLIIKNGRQEVIYFNYNPNLRYICSDLSETAYINQRISEYGYSNCYINTYCSFTPGGTFYTIQGNTKFDANNDGCDMADVSIPNLKYSISSGTSSGLLISNTSGNYSIPVNAGTHTVTPVFEIPAYFNVTPASVSVAFPAQASPFTQDFCLTANGNHPDLEVVLLPVSPARPGFDAPYRLIYRNKGTNVQSGTLNLNYSEAVVDFVSANPVTTNQTVNNLSWDFTNLLPFETREISVMLNINSPTETPAVNGGDFLQYNATITSAATDETPGDNGFSFKQFVVNSFDPNDKTCLEGTTIPPSEVGKYVHYIIRFENTGTFPAENIVVKDMIDAAKFDINSLVPIDGSHSFVTKIEGNKVEFIFENINLPFDNATNDGYVAFKIKTIPTLVAGNTFSNSASIYFDYNFPIVTNTATTTIQALSTHDFEFGQYFSLYPNPVNNVLTVETKQMIEVSSISIYNQLGQLVLVIPNAENIATVDVSGLASGNYFIKINSDKGTSNAKFIKL